MLIGWVLTSGTCNNCCLGCSFSGDGGLRTTGDNVLPFAVVRTVVVPELDLSEPAGEGGPEGRCRGSIGRAESMVEGLVVVEVNWWRVDVEDRMGLWWMRKEIDGVAGPKSGAASPDTLPKTLYSSLTREFVSQSSPNRNLVPRRSPMIG